MKSIGTDVPVHGAEGDERIRTAVCVAPNDPSYERCGYPISARLICFAYPVRGYSHCRHHLTDWERADRAAVARGGNTP